MIEYTIKQCKRYWQKNEKLVYGFFTKQQWPEYSSFSSCFVEMIKLPDDLEHYGKSGHFPIPANCFSGTYCFENINWGAVIFWYISCIHEQEYEKTNGTTLSYSSRLKCYNPVIWEKAWANRAALIVRRLISQDHRTDPDVLFGLKPEAEIIISHDLDAIHKTTPIRLKQSVFNLYSSVRKIFSMELKNSAMSFRKALSFLLSQDNYNHLPEMLNKEQSMGLNSIIYIYGKDKANGFKEWLINPSYSIIREKQLTGIIKKYADSGFIVGLHQSINSWDSGSDMIDEKIRIERVFSLAIETCRQHWLNFSWEKTWKAQYESGFKLDSTLGFNDRTGYRNGAALLYQPWDHFSAKHHNICVVPMVLMDSHLYCNGCLSEKGVMNKIDDVIEEIAFVGGIATINWHPHTLGKDYGWEKSYDYMLSLISEKYAVDLQSFFTRYFQPVDGQ